MITALFLPFLGRWQIANRQQQNTNVLLLTIFTPVFDIFLDNKNLIVNVHAVTVFHPQLCTMQVLIITMFSIEFSVGNGQCLN